MDEMEKVYKRQLLEKDEIVLELESKLEHLDAEIVRYSKEVADRKTSEKKQDDRVHAVLSRMNGGSLIA